MTTENRFGHENHSLGSQERRPEDFITVKSSVRVRNRKKNALACSVVQGCYVLAEK